VFIDTASAHELPRIFESLKKCLKLRDKYISYSCQRLGDNPKDHDGHFTGLPNGISGAIGVKPDAIYAPQPGTSSTSPYEPWKLYPRPPPPHWHWKDKTQPVPQSQSSISASSTDDEEFDFGKCAIPGADPWEFALDEKGVYQVYESLEGSCPSTLGRGFPVKSVVTACTRSRTQSTDLRCADVTRVFHGPRLRFRRHRRWTY
jgi:AMP deaminase